MFKNLTICGIQPEDQDEFRGEEDDPLRREIRPGLPPPQAGFTPEFIIDTKEREGEERKRGE